MIILIVLLLSILSGILYRMGGSDNYNTKARDIGCNVICNSTFFILLLLKGFTIDLSLFLLYFLSIGLLLASLTTYWKKKGTGGNYFTWGLTGFFYGLSAIPFIFYTHIWLNFTIRIVCLTLFVMLWWKKHPQSITLFRTTWDGSQIEEFGRGFILTATVLLFLL